MMNFLRTYWNATKKMPYTKNPSTKSRVKNVILTKVRILDSRLRGNDESLFRADAESSERYVPDFVLVVDDDGYTGQEIRPMS